jgi:glycosyltransferase involved in cell wall biosynthesis
MKLLWHWFTMGPYHFARMSALGRQPGMQLTVVETTRYDDHGWQRTETRYPFELITLAETQLGRQTHRAVRGRYYQALEAAAPDVIVESGYAEPYSRDALFLYKRDHPKLLTLLWSESTAFDHRRFWAAEKYKSWVLSYFDGALVAGGPHSRYMQELGMPSDVIAIIGGTVDNELFATRADEMRAAAIGNERLSAMPYFLYVGRFTSAKNLPFLLRAFHLYRVMSPGLAHDLVLVGSGPEEETLRSLTRDLRIDGVHFVGNKQLDELLPYYAFAQAFVIASKSEPWGLVINEAMASGLPVLASSMCGAAEDLVIPHETGLLFDPNRTEELAHCFGEIAANPQQAAEMGTKARLRVQSKLSLGRYVSQITSHLERLGGAAVFEARRPGTWPRVLSYFEQLVMRI